MDFFTILWSFYVRNDIQDAELEVRKAEKRIKSTQNINLLGSIAKQPVHQTRPCRTGKNAE